MSRLSLYAQELIAERKLQVSLTETRNFQVPVKQARSTRAFQKRMYEAAKVSRLTVDWPITITSANAEILVSAIALRSRLRQLERDDDYFRNMLGLWENNIVGDHGIKLRPKLKKADGTFDQDMILAIRQAWHEYLEEENCTVMGNMEGVKVQRLAARRLAVDGAMLLREYKGFNNDFGYAVEPIEIDRLDHNYNRRSSPTDNEIQFGIEMDKWKRPIAYHILTRHPGDVFAWQYGPKYRERVPADQIIAIWDIERADQRIGMPLWPSVATRLHHLYKYEESEAIAARVAAAKGGWFEKTDESGEYAGEEDAKGNKILDTEPGQWEELPLNWKAVPNDPSHPTDAYGDFVKGQLRGASAGAGLPYNSVASDLEGVNYSSIRAGLLDARDGFRWGQRLLTKKLVRKWFRNWLPYAVISGKLKVPFSMVEEIKACAYWQGRGWPWVDPLKDVQASIMAVGGGLTSLRREIEEDGGDIDEIFEEQEEDNKLAEKHGLDFNPTKPVVESAPEGEAKAGKEQPEPEPKTKSRKSVDTRKRVSG